MLTGNGKDFNDISLIKGSTNLETTQFMEEGSFQQDVMGQLGGGGRLLSPAKSGNGASQQPLHFDRILENLDNLEDD